MPTHLNSSSSSSSVIWIFTLSLSLLTSRKVKLFKKDIKCRMYSGRVKYPLLWGAAISALIQVGRG